MSLGELMLQLQNERKQRKINNMQKVVPYLKSLYDFKEEEELNELNKQKREDEQKFKMELEDQKLNNNIFLENVRSNNRWNENRLQNQNDVNNMIIEKSIDKENKKDLAVFENEIKNNNPDPTKINQSDKTKADKQRTDYLLKNGKIISKEDDKGVVTKILNLNGEEYDLNSEVGKEYQKAKAFAPVNKRIENIKNNTLTDLMDDIKLYSFAYDTTKFSQEGKTQYYNGKKIKDDDKAMYQSKIKNNKKSYNALVELTNLYQFEILPDKYAKFEDIWNVQKAALKKKFPQLTEFQLRSKLHSELIKNKKFVRNPRS